MYSVRDSVQSKKLSELIDCVTSCNFSYGLAELKEKIESAISDGFQIDYADDYNIGPLIMWAIWKPSPLGEDIAQLLISLNADVNVATVHSNEHVLDEAIRRKRSLKLINSIITAGAKLDAQDNMRITAFDEAATLYIYDAEDKDPSYSLAVIKLLLDNGANPYLSDCWLTSRDCDTAINTTRREEIKNLCANA